jgi:hypothetical protein
MSVSLAGYPRLAQLMGLGSDIAILRRFRRLNMLSLLSLQAELLYLEKEFDEVVDEDVKEGRDFHMGFSKLFASKDVGDTSQLEKLRDIKDKLKEYSKWGFEGWNMLESVQF